MSLLCRWKLKRQLEQLDTSPHLLSIIILLRPEKGLISFHSRPLQPSEGWSYKPGQHTGWNHFMEGKFSKSLTLHQEGCYLSVSSRRIYYLVGGVSLSKGVNRTTFLASLRPSKKKSYLDRSLNATNPWVVYLFDDRYNPCQGSNSVMVM